MDVVSYLLGKNSSGGGSSDLNWNQLGYSETPAPITNGFNYARDIYNNWDNTKTSLKNEYFNNKEIVFMPLVDTSNITDMESAFQGCSRLLYFPSLNTSNVTTMFKTFSNCSGLISIPLFDTSVVTDTGQMFYNCQALKDVPLFNFESVTYNNNMFQGCYNLSDESLDNILQICIGMTLMSTKTLKNMGFISNYYKATRIQALPHYQDFIDAGWTIGYA